MRKCILECRYIREYLGYSTENITGTLDPHIDGILGTLIDIMLQDSDVDDGRGLDKETKCNASDWAEVDTSFSQRWEYYAIEYWDEDDDG